MQSTTCPRIKEKRKRNTFDTDASRATTSKSPKRPRSPDVPSAQKCWLDALPQDVCVKIALLLYDRNSSDPLLPLAQTSCHSYTAVRAALQSSLTITREGLISKWCELFREGLLCVDVTHVSNSVHLEKILKIPSLQKARICADHRSVKGITGAPSLQSLSIFQGERIKAATFPVLRNALQSLDLTELTLDCALRKRSKRCPLMKLLDHDYVWTIARHLPRMKMLDLKCRQVDPDLSWACLIAQFPALERLTMHDKLWVSGELTSARLHQFRSIRLNRIRPQDIDRVHELGTNITSITIARSSAKPMTSEQIQYLSICTKLTLLEARIEPGAECGLMMLPKSMRSLRLTWGSSKEGGYFQHYAPYPGGMLSIIKRLPNLNTLHLYQVKIPRGELAEMLETMGDRLLEFGISEHGQDESPIERLRIVVEALAMYNPNLRHFRAKDYESFPFPARSDPRNVSRLLSGLSVLGNRTSISNCVIPALTVRLMCGAQKKRAVYR